MKKKIIILICLISLATSIYTQQTNENNITLLSGSNIYVRIFLFFFPISNNYDLFYTINNNKINLEIKIEKENINTEPLTPSYFETDLVIHIKDINILESHREKIPVTIQCNKKFIKKNVKFTIYRENEIIILKGSLNNLHIKDITENDYFKNRLNWNFPFYFDLRFKLK